ncbi:MAG: glycosyltransferase [Nitrososphaerota archaeon]|jgi:glycosyltransferase involved in cell wall biosynthesis|uniref:glycosyltransferase family 4 protein n=1 Tax=Candidatus Bathycorpusculum sp. TaxID=2994959 RepID=UPI0028387864|nr:glycosyltransferase [Candidatus Termiticorpusculum sp.]MCL2257893.1 glycosyltransferase [Candidatus Termiticorpusculum sp.]MCL2291981.1 glycosyltransferase [Candidatus Termiticorpusculum sp.]MDR0461662.1 glycosyltransferase [Nitrososphaerota archaeon]
MSTKVSSNSGSKQVSIKLRILWHSVAPWIASGYGKTTREVCTRLPKYGFQPFISAYYGAEPGGIPPYEIPVLPSKEGYYGIASATQYCKQYKIDVGILFTDWWAFKDFPQLIPRATLYGPMDQVNYSEELIEFTRKFHRVIGLCKWQQDCLADAGIASDYIYHGVNTDIFKPVDKKTVRKKMGVTDDDDVFVFGTVAANADKEDRKSHTRSMKAMRYFLDQNPDVKNIIWLYHTVPNDPNGLPLLSIAHKFGLDDVIRFMDPTAASLMFAEEDLAMLMNCFDVHLLCSKREGFGMPILETQSCGVPNICHDFSSMTELVQGHGWLCKSLGSELNLETTPINGETATPDVYSIADCIADAYFHPDQIKKYSEASRTFALPYNWDNIVENQWVPILAKMAGNTKRVT